ncbi:MAG: hypothetical protein ACREDL_13795, partial [Bradyrhizobium sp.]
GDSMTGHLRFGFAALLLAGFSTSPAAANPLADLFSINATPHINAAPSEASTPASPEQKCLPQPGKSTAAGHWFYRMHDHRRCWFQAAEGSVRVRKQFHQRVHHRAVKRRASASDEREAALRKRKSVMDAHAELLRSAPVQTAPPAPPAPDIKVVDAAVVPVTGAAAMVPPAPVLAKPALDQPAPGQRLARQVNVERLLAAAPAAVPAASVSPAAPVAAPATQVSQGQGRTTTWIGVLLMMLGLVLLFGSSRVFRRPLPGQ